MGERRLRYDPGSARCGGEFSVGQIERHQIKWIAVVGSVGAVTLAISRLQVAGISDVAWVAGLLLFVLSVMASEFNH